MFIPTLYTKQTSNNGIAILKRAIEEKLQPMKNALLSFEGPVSIGTPSVVYNVLFDTGSCQFWVENDNGKLQQSSTLSSTGKSAIPLRYMDGTIVEGTLVKDTVSIGNTTVQSLELESAHIVTDQNIDGLMGLCRSTPDGYSTSFLDAAVSSGVLEKRLFGISVSSDTSESTINFGTLDSTAYIGNITYTPVATDSMYWQSDLSSISGTYNWSGTFPVIFDSGTSLVILPESMHDAIGTNLNLMKGTNGMYMTTTSKCPETLGTFNMTFAHHMSISVPMEKLFFYYGGNCYLGMMGGTINHIILGNSMTRWFYTVYDGENNRVGFGQTSYGIVGGGPVPPDGGLDKALLYGIIVGVGLFLFLVVYMFYKWCRSRK